MYYSKIVLLLGCLAFAACKNTSTTTATPVKELRTEEKTAISLEEAPSTERNLSKESDTKAEKPTIKIKEVGNEGKTSTASSKKTLGPVTNQTNTSATIQVKESQKEISSKTISTKQEVTKSDIKIIETKEKIVETVKEITPPPVPVTQPQIVTKAPPPPVKKEVEKKEIAKETVVLKKTLDHKLWDGVLRKYVSAKGKVNYKGLKVDPNFEAYLQLLKDNPVESDWSRNKKMAYWINAYNAFTIKLITDNYPTSSITKLHGGKPWDHKWIQLGEKTYTLNDIEHKILRPQFKDARIHFAVNCAATSCPPVLNRAWTSSNLSSNLDKQAKLFINNSAFNTISSNKVELSKIFEWYQEDFGDLIAYINKYAGTKAKAGAKVSFKDYDWALNE